MEAARPAFVQMDGARDRDAAKVSFFDGWTARDHTTPGCELVRVPALPPEERLACVLEPLPG